MANPEHLAILQDALDKKDITIWNNWRNQYRNIRPNLSSVNLMDADLRRANLIEANLIEANLIEANLSYANLRRANLSLANLRRANLSYANLIEANLSYANLIEANLSLANLEKTILKDTNFEKIIFLQTKFSDVDLSTVLNLDQADVRGPCTVGIDTLYKSHAIISKPWFHQFLKDCGVPDIMITYLPSLVEASMSFYSCFISYSTADEEFATKLFEALRDKGIRVWFAPDQLLPGQKLADEIDRGIKHWDKVILCCSKSSMTEKWWVDFEVEKTFSKSRHLQREWGESVDVLVPLNLDGYVVSKEFQESRSHADVILSYFIEDCTEWVDDDAFNRMVDRIVRSLREDGGNEPPPPSKLKPKKKP